MEPPSVRRYNVKVCDPIAFRSSSVKWPRPAIEKAFFRLGSCSYISRVKASFVPIFIITIPAKRYPPLREAMDVTMSDRLDH
jgi:hypothetical protein